METMSELEIALERISELEQEIKIAAEAYRKLDYNLALAQWKLDKYREPIKEFVKKLEHFFDD